MIGQSIQINKLPYKTLGDGKKIPMIGFGTYQFTSNDLPDVLKSAILDHGYRMIDTAD